jgi:hypothetical protein
MGSRDFAVSSKSPLNGAGVDIPSGLRSTFVSFGRVVLSKSIFYGTWPQDVRQAVFGKKNIVCFDNCSSFYFCHIYSFLFFSGYVKGVSGV